MFVWQYIAIAIVYMSPGVHAQASVLNEMCLCLSFVCDQLSDFASCVSWHTCSHLHLFRRKKEIKVDDSCVRWRLYQSLLNPEVPLTQFFGRQILYWGYFCCWVCNQVWVGARAHARGTGVYDIKRIKRVAWRNECLLALQTGCLPSPPAESEKDVMRLVWWNRVCFFWGVLLFV